MKEKPTFKRALSDAIYSAHRLRDIATSKTRRFHKDELNRHLRNINILRQQYGGNFNAEEQKMITEYVPSISRAINDGRFEEVEVFADGLLDTFTTKTAVTHRRQASISRKTPRITPKVGKLR